MEAHPVPQNVTDFEFHLIGDMTVKQFGYLAVGVGVAYILFITLSKPLPLIAWPLIVFFALTGVAFAFLPISERPLDHWVGAYFKAIFKPTIRYWKGQKKIDNPSLFSSRLSMYIASLGGAIYKEQKTPVLVSTPRLSTISQMAPNAVPMVNARPGVISPPETLTQQQSPQPPAVQEKENELPSAKELEKTVELAKEAQIVQHEIVDTEKLLDNIRTKSAVPGEDAKEYTEDFQKALNKLQGLTSEASKISEEMAKLAHTPTTPVLPREVVPATKKQVATNIVLTSTANVINGIVTDISGNYLEGAIVVTHDKQGLPVRALKTNKLGQFVAATPLPNGVYTLSIEKENLNFDNVQITLDGKVIRPIVVSAKKGVVA